jgi:hypothetical protein
MECVRLRVKDLDFMTNQIHVHDTKGQNDRITILPKAIKASLLRHLTKVKAIYEQDLAEGIGEVYLPYAIDRKYPSASRSWTWQYVFPASRRSIDPRTGKKDVIIFPKHCSSEPSNLRSAQPEFQSRGAVIRFVIVSRRIFSKRDMIFAPFNNCWVIKMSALP